MWHVDFHTAYAYHKLSPWFLSPRPKHIQIFDVGRNYNKTLSRTQPRAVATENRYVGQHKLLAVNVICVHFLSTLQSSWCFVYFKQQNKTIRRLGTSYEIIKASEFCKLKQVRAEEIIRVQKYARGFLLLLRNNWGNGSRILNCPWSHHWR